MKIYEMEQRTPEWYEVRKLKFTASHASTIMAMGKGLETLIEEMLAEYYSSGCYEEFSNKYRNAQTERGNEFEDKARSIYQLETGSIIKQVGFIEQSEHIGCSPDGLVNEDGLVEFKCHNDIVFLRLCETGKIDKKYTDQIQYQLYVTGRSYCDYFGFNPNFEPCYYTKRFTPDPEVFQRLNEALPYAIQRLKARKEIMDRILKAA